VVVAKSTPQRLPILTRLFTQPSQSVLSLLGTFITCYIVLDFNRKHVIFSSINNKIGSRLTLLLGTTGYALNIGSYLSVTQCLEILLVSGADHTNSALNIHPGAKGFVIGSGAILGICAGLLWTAQGSLMMAYPTEGQKGVFVGVFWAIFNLGGVVGSSVALGENIRSKVRNMFPLKMQRF
jgi:hypothetical protein